MNFQNHLKKVTLQNNLEIELLGEKSPVDTIWILQKKYFLGKRITYEYSINNTATFTNLEGSDELAPQLQQDLAQPRFAKDFIPRNMQPLCEKIPNPFKGKTLKRVFAEREIKPEKEGSLAIEGNGTGTTNIIQSFINKADLPSHEVEVGILKDLNEIFIPDGNFKRIVCQIVANGNWEIFIDEEGKGRIALSNSGSGLKTIIIVLVFFRLLPLIDKKALNNYVFCFEELENNLHPALLRRFLAFIYKICIEHGCIVFFTTHSNVSIDVFSKNKDAQIIHVTHNNGVSKTDSVKTYIDNKGVLDDLDVRASDLLQSNGVVWVEGPSDRIYFNRWIELWTEGALKEGTHYQCVFYGGRLLSHLDASTPEEIGKNGISILRVNRNSLILIDSDKRNSDTEINNTKKRIVKEIQDIGGFAWVTNGREIENYIPIEAVISFTGIQTEDQIEQFQNFFDYLNNIKANEGEKYRSKKPMLAEKIIPHLTLENSRSVLNLDTKMLEAIIVIKGWNSLEA